VLAALLVLTATTILVSYVDLGVFNTPIALVIAAAKAALVVVFFMHLVRAPRVAWLAAAGGLFWLGILVVLTMSDLMTRQTIPPVPGR
jgi:cytochrome c oxidase subunit 4